MILSDLDSCGDVDLCSSMAVCVDVPGGTECQCMAGYEGNGITCKDIDECLNKSICDVLRILTARARSCEHGSRNHKDKAFH